MSDERTPSEEITEAIQAIEYGFPNLDLASRLAFVVRNTAGQAVFTTSLSIEDQAILDALAETARDIRVVTLETGRLFPETLALIDASQTRYGIVIDAVRPDPADETAYVARYGYNGFYESLAARHACCDFRKVKPLRRTLSDAAVWITGLRRGQSRARVQTPFAAWDPMHNLIKVNPLADWELNQISTYVAARNVPVNPLHERGFPSIGCAPCTRAIRPGEPERAGRWWWENDAKRECGLHTANAQPPTDTQEHAYA